MIPQPNYAMCTLLRQSFLILLLLSGYIRLQGQSGECILVIQGARASAQEDFIRNSADAAIAGLAAFPGPPRITALRPSGATEKGSALGPRPPRQEQTYAHKQQLLEQIRHALCHDSCQNVVIVLIGHGIGNADNLDSIPKDSLSGAMKIGPGNCCNDIITAAEIAALIDSCQRSVKLVSAACYSESMVRGIRHHLRSKHLAGVGIASSPWDSMSYADGLAHDVMVYEFIKYLMQDFFLILSDPNAMAELRKRAEDLRKANTEKNKKIQAENTALAKAKEDCEKALGDLKKKLDDLDAQIKKAQEDLDTAKKITDLLKARKALWDEHDKAKGKEKDAARKKLKDNQDALKALNYTGAVGKGAMDKAIQQYEDLTKKLEQQILDLQKQWKDTNVAHVYKGAECDSILHLDPLALLHDSLPLMEVLLNEAFKSARLKTKSSQAVQPIPTGTVGVPVPERPTTQLQVGDAWFHFYKVWDKAANKCVVVGFQANAQGVPVGPIKSLECDTACLVTRFAYRANDTDKEIKILKDGKGKHTVLHGETETKDFRFLAVQIPLIIPGQMLTSLYLTMGVGEPEALFIPDGQVLEYDYQDGILHILFHHQLYDRALTIQFLEHGDALVTLQDGMPYRLSDARLFHLASGNHEPVAALGLIRREASWEGSLQWPGHYPALSVITASLPDHEEEGLHCLTPQGPLWIRHGGEMPEDRFWEMGTQGGPVHLVVSPHPFITWATLTHAPEGTHLNWDLESEHLSPTQWATFAGMYIQTIGPGGMILATTFVPKDQSHILIPEHPSGATIGFAWITASGYGLYDVVHSSIPQYAFGPSHFLAQPPSDWTLKDNNEGDVRDAGSPAFPELVVRPNPFSEQTTLHVPVLTAGPVLTEVFTLAGQRIWSVMDHLASGVHMLALEGNRFPHSGHYICRVTTPDSVFTHMLVLARP
jgi:hypothetical protein